MIEFQVFQREPADGYHVFKVFLDGTCVFAHELCKHKDLKQLYDELNNELLFLSDYIQELSNK